LTLGRLLGVTLGIGLACTGVHAGGLTLELVGEARLPAGVELEGTVVGGLSGLAWDSERDLYLAVSDDKGDHGPARFYTLAVDLSQGRLEAGGVRVVGFTPLRDDVGRPLPPDAVDPEGIALAPDGSLFLSSEGNRRVLTPPHLRRLGRDGRIGDGLPVPAHYLPGDGVGVRRNAAFEALAVTPDGRTLVAGLEAALVQDGKPASPDAGSPARILLFDLEGMRARAEYLYPVDPLPGPPREAGGFVEGGLSELVALDERRLVTLERGYAEGAGNWARLFEVDLAGATDLTGAASLEQLDPGAVRPVGKRLLLDLGTLGRPVDNLEGMTLGPRLPDGRRSLILVSDDNFNHGRQVTQFLAFAVDDPGGGVRVVRARDVQGRGHLSPLAGEEVVGVVGVVTAVERAGAFFLQDPEPDDDPATSEGLFVRPAAGQLEVAVGDLVRASGAVAEVGRAQDLPLTALVEAAVVVVERGRPLPAPVVLGAAGRPVPARVVDDDALAVFEPDRDGVDFFESLEGMRVEVQRAVVVGPTSDRGEVVVVGDHGGGAGPWVGRRGGGLATTDADPNPERIVLQALTGDPLPPLTVGDRLAGRVVGVMSSEYGRYRVLVDGRRPEVTPGPLTPEVTDLVREPGRLTVATFNVENLSAISGDWKMAMVARVIVNHLRSPEIIALQEIQDDSGPDDDGVVTAAETLARLVEAVAAAGGPRYAWRQVDPVDNADGGRPGANIRVVTLADPARVRFLDRGAAGSTDSICVTADGALSASPGRIAARHPAFVAEPATGDEGGRKPLAVELEVDGRRLVVVNLHLRSKWGDDPEYGRFQPPRRPSEVQRREQAQVVNDFVWRLLAADPELPVVVLGDLNEHPERPPVTALLGAELVNLLDLLPPQERYTYVYFGASQVLDHILVAPALSGGAEVDVVHVNAEWPEGRRSSDHDPVVARFVWP